MLELSIGRIPAIVGAAGAVGRLAGHVRGMTDSPSVMALFDPGLRGEIDRVAGAMEADGLECLAVVMPPGEPKEALVTRLVAEARSAGIGAVVCIGGGSTMDAGKLVASLAAHGDAIATYRLAAAALPRERLPLIAVPTTAGTGAEATAVSVLSADDGTKYWFWAASLKPDLILHDPELMVGLPAAVTASTGIDALVHAMEAATNRNATEANNLFAYRAIVLAARWLPVAVKEPANLEARARMLEAATFAGVAIDNAGTAIAHNIAHALGSLAPVGHGRAVAIGMAATLTWNEAADPEVYAPVAQAMGIEGDLATGFLAFVRGLGLDLGVTGVKAAALAERMGRPENAAMLASNRRPCAPADLLKHAEAALSL